MIVDRIHHWAREQPDRPALIHNGTLWTYEAFAGAIGAARHHLAHLGLGRHDLAAICVGDLRAAWVTLLALRELGLETTCFESLDQAAIGAMFSGSSCACIVQGERHGNEARAQLERQGIRIIEIPATALAGLNAPPTAPPAQPGRGPGGHTLHTSGSTGGRKLIRIDPAIEDAADRNRARLLEYDRHTVQHGLDFGLWTGVGFKQTAAVWHVGGCVVLDQRTDRARRFFDHGVNRARLLPSSARAILDALPPDSTPRDDLEVCLGGVAIALVMAQETTRRIARGLTIVYGATELSATAIQSRFRSADDLEWLAPLGERRVQVVDENGFECAAGREGALRISLTPLDAQSYVGDPVASARAFRDGYFYPADLAVKRADGRVRILGRQDDVINFSGQKVPATFVEQTIQERLRVPEVCVFARAADDGGQELVIAIETDREPPDYELDALRREFPTFSLVRAVVLKAFPRASSTLKVRRGELKALVFSKASAN